ncbi:2-aminoethylphosphonate--pyruvate transaminase [Desulfococcus sp.]|uniref:2-aminoethylphosphonate--pyruvate transaminase n=1 Tax=Desulfococcus sp. TaxID=2025834 RepID=UPI0035939C68
MMNTTLLPNNPYLLLTPGPLSTTKSVKSVMLRDWCTWDDDYHQIVQSIRKQLTALANGRDSHTAVLMQGSGTFSVESTIITAVPSTGRLLVLANGAYGRRIGEIARRAGIPMVVHDSGETAPTDLTRLESALAADSGITHVAVVHCETTTGMLNPIEAVGCIARDHGKVCIVDAMSSFGGIPIDIQAVGADFLISSANKCIQGVPGMGFVIAGRKALENTRGRARSLSLDLYDQWETMETHQGKWRFTSPTHVVRAFAQALAELEEEGGVPRRWERFRNSHRILVQGMAELGFETLLPPQWQSPVITAFRSPSHPDYEFKKFYVRLKARGFVIYPGKVTDQETFRIGNIGDVHEADIRRLLTAVKNSRYWLED